MYRRVRDFEHSTLCRAMGLDQARFYFDIPSSCRGTGSNSTGNRVGRRIDGYVMIAGDGTPFGKLAVITESDRVRDDDPTDLRDLLRLG